MGNQNCCSATEEKFEAVERKDLPNPDAPVLEVPVGTQNKPRADEFEIILDKTDGQRLGCDVDHEDGVTLQVDAITGGLIEAWNLKNPDQAVKVSDRIVEVNGKRGDVLQLVDECKKPKVLRLFIQPGAERK
mmetsp:Transcript_63574/g.113128  ORF Transcript_63574/g.113128 Transcript_63574/m.113128 type:complete len:132 (+) Transcript_63574:88-483(+)|eukprot:CAMPEP_0197649358 /NCGR_PEP_ID=MMETSP1338-20131121/28307_1 /TAXON_ID=43686 ORGANISM="Pelagodinium beii, Strain RCC1491" /NCGR_SAMPLE_ID=MMETSP1338 /ASSEMBLY_ACC=CAM_ASM_000754 /LENGTH=131 /DNA_ID=CAMNT_0043223519 /DNA_START=88 /DNA_END=483 /DNA_ORIENTATION=-